MVINKIEIVINNNTFTKPSFCNNPEMIVKMQNIKAMHTNSITVSLILILLKFSYLLLCHVIAFLLQYDTSGHSYRF